LRESFAVVKDCSSAGTHLSICFFLLLASKMLCGCTNEAPAQLLSYPS
jgi:hypothetical protein